MRGNFFMGLAIGALAGVVAMENKSKAKQLVQKGKDIMEQMTEGNTAGGSSSTGSENQQ